MARIKETGDEWVVEPAPIELPEETPATTPDDVPAEPAEVPVG